MNSLLKLKEEIMAKEIKTEGEVKKGFRLPKLGTFITLTPIKRGSAMIKDPEHIGYFKYPDTEISHILPRNINNGNWIPCLTTDEQEFLEEELNVDLSFRKDNIYWSERRVKVRCTPELIKNGLKMDISTADGYLDYKILSKQGTICDSWDKRFDNMEYQFALVADGEILDSAVETANIKQEVFEYFSKIKNGRKKLYDVLTVYGKKPEPTTSIDYLRTEVWNIVDTVPAKFMKIVQDPDFEMKASISDYLTSGALKLEGRTTYKLGYGSEDVIGRTLKDAINYLKDRKNSATILELDARLIKFED